MKSVNKVGAASSFSPTQAYVRIPTFLDEANTYVGIPLCNCPARGGRQHKINNKYLIVYSCHISPAKLLTYYPSPNDTTL